MMATTKLPLMQTVCPNVPSYHRRELIRESLREGVIPDVESTGFDFRITHAGEGIRGAVDQRLPETARAVFTLTGGSVLFVT